MADIVSSRALLRFFQEQIMRRFFVLSRTFLPPTTEIRCPCFLSDIFLSIPFQYPHLGRWRSRCCCCCNDHCLTKKQDNKSIWKMFIRLKRRRIGAGTEIGSPIFFSYCSRFQISNISFRYWHLSLIFCFMKHCLQVQVPVKWTISHFGILGLGSLIGTNILVMKLK